MCELIPAQEKKKKRGVTRSTINTAGSSRDAIREPRLLDAVSRTNKLPHDTDHTSFDQASRQDDKASEKRMAIEHH